MKQLMILVAALVLAVPAMADTFGSGANQFTIDFVPISGDAGDLGSWSAGSNYTFSGVNSGDYRIGKYEITVNQCQKAGFDGGYWLGEQPATRFSWYQAAQFVNWLNTNTSNTVAYKFNGSTFTVWDVTDPGYDASNPFRNKNAKYFLPTEDEWVKAAYWDGSSLQTWATTDNTQPIMNVDSRYGSSTGGPWAVGSGTEELNGTFDMMGNAWEWMESPYHSGDYTSGSARGLRGGSYNSYDFGLASSGRGYFNPGFESSSVGFRVASVPEPASLALLFLGGLALRYRKR